MDTRIEKWKTKLLDLSKRNRLINFRETKRSSIKIVTPHISEFYRKLVINEETLDFPLIMEDEENDSDNDLEHNVKESEIIGDITTNQSIRELQKTLRNLRNKSKTAMEEQGVNILYVSFGFLKWTESIDSNQLITSPIVLVPVKLTLESITAPYRIDLHEDEIVVNPTLSYKLFNDFGIILPDFDDYEEDIKGYLDLVKQKVSNNKWDIDSEVGLSLLSFLKINMYKDLDNNRDKLSQNPIIKALTGDSSDIASISDEYNNYNHDEKIKPIDTFQVLDADSSQQDAILYAKKGVSFVLQGPPGTGKSQTIANIIAESLSEGKKVLFVSEKMAALDVVHKRLTQTGLDDFCLTLHSYKANKKEVLKELGKTMGLDKIKLQDDAISKLEFLNVKREELNRYKNEVHTPCPPLGKSIYEINGRLAKLKDTPDLIFNLNDIETTTPEMLNQYVFALEDLKKTIGKMNEDFYSNPWRNSIVSNVTHELRHDIETNLTSLNPKLVLLSKNSKMLLEDLELGLDINLDSVHDILRILDVISKSPKVPLSWVYEDDIIDLMDQAERFRDLKMEYKELRDTLLDKYEIDYLDLPASQIDEVFGDSLERLKKILNPTKFNNQDLMVTASIETKISLEKNCNGLRNAKLASDEVVSLLNVNKISNINELGELTDLLGRVISNPRPTTEWFNDDKFEIVKKVCKEAKDVHDELYREKEKILLSFEKEVFDINSIEMLKRFKMEYNSITKIFKKIYREDKKLIQSLHKETSKKIDDNYIVMVLNDLKNIAGKESWITNNENILVDFFGNHYTKGYTEWDQVEKSILDFAKIREYFGITGISTQLQKMLLEPNNIIGDIGSYYEKMRSVLSLDPQGTLNDIFLLAIKAESMDLDELIQLMQSSVTILNKTHEEHMKMIMYSKNNYCFEDQLKNFNGLKRMQYISSQIESQSEDLKINFKYLYEGIDTDWEKILSALTWTYDFRSIRSKYLLEPSIIDKLCTDDEFIADTIDHLNEFKIQASSIENDIKWFMSLFDHNEEIRNTNIDRLIARIHNCKNNLSSLEDWIDFRRSRENCREIGLDEYVKQVESNNISGDMIVKSFLKRFYRLWLDFAMPQFPAVNAFRRRSQEGRIKDFSRLDKTQLVIARIRVKERLISRLPDINNFTSARDEVGVLRRELNKQRRIKPLRKLFKEIPNLLMTLKPCLMMSPLSVSLFLESDSYNFDVVIFDEASQVRTEDSIGAIMRAKQVIIAGDTKQLPPTNFFTASISDDEFDTDDYEEEDSIDFEGYDSVLDESITVLLERTLRWHYRSRHEHLIAFSNARIYNSNLITFPSHIDRLKDNGVEYIYVPHGIYDRGGKKDNLAESQKVAEMVFEHIKAYPNRSLGIVTFSEAQQQSVSSAIRQKRLKNQEHENFFAEDKEDRFFVKNLENVQGDERDTIIFSIGYAKDHNGVMYMNFGPLSKNGGYRRLNVAITRAKYNIKLVGSIHPTDIDLERVNSEGVKMLRSYIEFAINGPKVLQQELTVPLIVNTESPFEEAVHDYLVANGYQVATQIGCSGYRIDMGVKHPTLSGRFVIGIECDGATYHSARTARERDRLRQTILEDIGWKIYRVWSTDWIKDPISEGNRLINAIEKTITEYTDNSILEHYEIENEENSEINESLLIDESPTQMEIEDFDEDKPLYDFIRYQETDVYDVDRHPDNLTYIANTIKYVVEKEYPIHYELLFKRLAVIFGNQRVTNIIRENVEYVYDKKLKNKIELKEGFYWIKNSESVRVRVPNEIGHKRQIHQISTEELAEAMYTISKNSFGIMDKDLKIATARVFGFNRIGDNILNRLDDAYTYLLEQGKN